MLYTFYNGMIVKIDESLAEVFESSSEGFMFNTRVSMDILYIIPFIEPSLSQKN